MAENNVFARIHGLEPLQPSGVDVGRWVPSYNFELLEGRFVPCHHLELYKKILETYGHLFPASVTEGLMPPVLLSAVTMTLDLIVEIEGSKELSREHLDVWLAKLKFATVMGLSVTWLRSFVEELDRGFNSSQFVVEARTKLRDLHIRLEEVRGMKADAEIELIAFTDRINNSINRILTELEKDFELIAITDRIRNAYAEELKIEVFINSTNRILTELEKDFSGQL